MPAHSDAEHPQSSRDRLLADIADAADALTDPRRHIEPIYDADQHRNKRMRRVYATTVPGLIQQLREAAEPGTTGDTTGVRSIPDSRPPLALNAVSLLAAIEYGAARRCLAMGAAPRDTVESTIRMFVGESGQWDSDTQRSLAGELRSWRVQAEVITQWRADPVELLAPCPAEVEPGWICNARGTLLADPDTGTARCVACGAKWSPDDAAAKGGLFDQVKTYRDTSRSAAEKVRGEVREAKWAARDAEAAARRQRQEASAA